MTRYLSFQQSGIARLARADHGDADETQHGKTDAMRACEATGDRIRLLDETYKPIAEAWRGSNGVFFRWLP